MRNPFRTFRKPSRKPLSKKKLRRYNGYDKLDEALFEATLAMQKWFANYMNQLQESSNDKRTNDTSMVGVGLTTR